MKKEIKKHIAKIIFIFIIILQVLTIIYATTKRERLHIDEYFSLGFISYENMYIHSNEDFFNTWHNKEYFENYLAVDGNEQYNFSPVYDNQVKDVHPPLYYLLLRIFSNFNIGNISIWPGIILNIVLFIISMCVLYQICIKVFNNKKYALLVCLVAGFTMGITQIAIYLRMYQLFALASLLLLYWHLCNKDKENLSFKSLLSLFFIVLGGFLTHYYFSIIAIALFIVHFIRNLKNKNYKVLLKYSLTLIVTVVAATLIFPAWIDHVFYGYRGTEAFMRFTKTMNLFTSLLTRFVVIVINYELFNGFFGAIVIILAVFVAGAIYLKFKNKIIIFNKINSDMLYINFSAIFYLLIIVMVVPYIELRYLSPILIYIVIMLIYYLKKFGEIIFENKETLFKVLSVIFVFISIINILKIDNGTFMYKSDGLLLEQLKEDVEGKQLIYIKNEETVEMYNQYLFFLMYDRSIVLKDSENLLEDIETVIKEDGADSKNYVIVFDNSIFYKIYQEGNANRFKVLGGMPDCIVITNYVIL